MPNDTDHCGKPKWQKGRIVGNELYPEDNGRQLWIRIGSRSRRSITEMKNGRHREEICYETHLRDAKNQVIVYGVDVIELLPIFEVDVRPIRCVEWLAEPNEGVSDRA